MPRPRKQLLLKLGVFLLLLGDQVNGQILEPAAQQLADMPVFRLLRELPQAHSGIPLLVPWGNAAQVTETGILALTYHQVDDLDKYWVEDAAGERQRAFVLVGDPVEDLALLKIERPAKRSFELASDRLPVKGQAIQFIGPATSPERGVRVSTGTVLHARMMTTFANDIPIDGTAIPGDSGSPVIDTEGRLIGILRAGKFGTRITAVHARELLPMLALVPGREPFTNDPNLRGDQRVRALLALWGIVREDDENWRATPNGATLAVAACAGDVEAINWLLSVGVDINWQGRDNATPLIYAILRYQTDSAIALVEHGASFTAEIGRHSAIGLAAATGQVELLQAMILAGANLAECDGTGCTPLHHAACKGDVKSIALILDEGISVDLPSNSGATPLMIAASGVHGLNVDALLRYGAEVNATDPDGKTALHYAAESGKCQMIDVLLKAGADLQARTLRGHSAMLWAARADTPCSAEALIGAGLDVNVTSARSETPLMVAARYGKREVVTWLIDHGAQIDAKDIDELTAFDWSFQRTDNSGRAVREALQTAVDRSVRP